MGTDSFHTFSVQYCNSSPNPRTFCGGDGIFLVSVMRPSVLSLSNRLNATSSRNPESNHLGNSPC